MKSILLAIAMLLASHAQADEASKREKILKLARAQGLEHMFQQQLDQSKASVAAMGTDIINKMMADSGMAADKQDPKLQAVMAKFMQRAAMLFSAKEYADTWSASYGQNVSEQDIDQMLAYYTSPLGQRDVQASQAAMGKFSQTVAVKSRKRFNALITDLMKELNAIAPK